MLRLIWRITDFADEVVEIGHRDDFVAADNMAEGHDGVRLVEGIGEILQSLVHAAQADGQRRLEIRARPFADGLRNFNRLFLHFLRIVTRIDDDDGVLLQHEHITIALALQDVLGTFGDLLLELLVLTLRMNLLLAIVIDAQLHGEKTAVLQRKPVRGHLLLQHIF